MALPPRPDEARLALNADDLLFILAPAGLIESLLARLGLHPHFLDLPYDAPVLHL